MTIRQQLNYSISSNRKTSEQLIESITLKINDNATNGMYIIHRAAINQLNNQRKGNACTKTKGEVRGGGRKPWKQKGTGRARAGSIRSPLRNGGGIIFGPKPKIYAQKINKKENQLAIRNIIANKFPITTAVDSFMTNLDCPNTKEAEKYLKHLGLRIQKEKKILIITEINNQNTYLSIRNLKNVNLINVHHLNILDLLNATHIIVTQKSLRLIEQIYG